MRLMRRGRLRYPAVPAVGGLEQAGAPVARFHDAIRFRIPNYKYGDGTQHGWIERLFGDTCEVTLRRNGQVVGTAPSSWWQFSVPAAEAWYELDVKVVNGADNWMETSVRTESTWRFRSGRPAKERAVLPLVQPDYYLETGPRNEVPAGAAYPLDIAPGYQPGANGPGKFTVTVDVSYDDGVTWANAPVKPVGERMRATVPAAPGVGFATVRVVATDKAGNSLTQRIDRAWRISAAAPSAALPPA